MMEGTENLILRSPLCSILCLLVFLGSSSCEQEGFVSIRCCAESNFTDTDTTINWKPDKGWFPDRIDCRNISRPTTNYNGYDKARTFNIDSGKICYNLSTVKDQDYLVRGSFLFGDLLEASFDVTVGVTRISSVSSGGDLVVEGIFRATGQETDFCLVKVKGNPYMSELELRPLNDSGYLNNQSSTILKVVHRISIGSKVEIRYPVDPKDRIWEPPSSLDPTAVLIPSSGSDSSVQNASQTVPFQVLQTALTKSDRLDFTHVDLDTMEYNYTVFLHFLELNGSVTRGKRVFDIYINNLREIEIFDVLDSGSKYRKVTLNVKANGSLNLTLIRATNGSDSGPILNAYEIFQVHQRFPETNLEDAKAMKEVKDGLSVSNPDNDLFQSWFGDPCSPVSWEGLVCESFNHNISIIHLNISSKNLTGSVPPGTTKLANLKHLNLSHNDFIGNIPPFPASSMLISIDLSHNDFTGMLPEFLINLPDLRALYYGCNPNLTKQDHPVDRLKVTTDNGSCGGGGEGSQKTSSVHGLIIGTAVFGSFLFMVASGVLAVCFYRKRLMDRTRFRQKRYPITKNAIFSIPSMDDVAVKSINIQAYTLDYIESVTQEYKTMIGEGGFGSVYRGTLFDGQEVAVKVRSATSTQGTREFNNELDLLSAIRHDNLVPLLGYCSDNDQQILVYPFMSNGSLQDRLYGEASKRKILDWPTRLSIALGAARGLTYLHSFAGRCIIHRDVKSSNILMDDSMCAKVADFGFSKYAPQEGDSCASLEVRGTAGYLDPEYYSTQHLTAKSDVFSFGVVLLEIISGREPLNIHRPRNEWSLVEWAKPYVRESQIEEIVDPNIKGGYHLEAVWRVVEVALACIEPFSAYRPCMADIVRELEDALIIENNASEYMKSIDSFGGSNRFSIVIEKKIVLPPPPPPPPTQHPSPSEPSPLNAQPLPPPDPR